MFQENKLSTSDVTEYPSYSMGISSYSAPLPLFRDLPHSAADFISSTSLTTGPDVIYRSIESSSAAGAEVMSGSAWNDSSFGYGLNLRKGLDMEKSFPVWHHSFPSVQHFDKTKSIDDLQSPLIQSFPAPVVTHVPPSPPEYIDPCYNFGCQIQATELYASVLSYMKRNGVDVEPKPEKFRMKCKSYSSGALLCFVIRIYRDTKKSESVVECQRRTGCVLRFSELYKTLKKQIFDSNRDSVVSTPRRDEINTEHAQETTKCLLLMASSNYVDVKSKAVEALASLSGQDRTVQDILIKNGSVNLLLEGCVKYDKVEDVHRPSLTALANLSDGRADVCRAIAESSLRCLSEKYTSPKENCPQVVRECARVLTNIGVNLKDTMRDVDSVNTAVMNLSRSNDPLALQCARKLEDCLGMCS